MTEYLNRRNLMDQITSQDYQEMNGRQIGEAISRIFGDEQRLAMRQRRLYVLPPDAKPILPNIDDDTNERIREAWEKAFIEFQQDDRSIGFYANRVDNARTIVHCHSTMANFALNKWTARNISIDRIRIPLAVRSTGSNNYRIEVEDCPIPDKLLTEIAIEMIRVFGDDDVDLASERTRIVNMKDADKRLQSIALLNLVSTPETWTRIFNQNDMWVNPESRLATTQEMNQWMLMCRKIINKGVIVGEKGCMSYQEYRGQFQLGINYPYLRIKQLDSDGKEDGSMSIEIPTPIQIGGGEPIGWLLCSIDSNPTGWRQVTFQHGSLHLSKFNNRRTSQPVP